MSTSSSDFLIGSIVDDENRNRIDDGRRRSRRLEDEVRHISSERVSSLNKMLMNGLDGLDSNEVVQSLHSFTVTS